jgi:hypothetical protein
MFVGTQNYPVAVAISQIVEYELLYKLIIPPPGINPREMKI